MEHKTDGGFLGEGDDENDDDYGQDYSSSPKRMCHHVHQNEDVAIDRSNQSESEESTIHPLLIDHVAKKIFYFLEWSYTSKNVVACREVCRTWYHIITDGMKRKGLARKMVFGYGDTLRMGKFVDTMRNSMNVPFDDYKFDVNYFIEKNTDNFNEFLKICGPYIRCLSLNFGKHYSTNLMSMNFEDCSFSNLKSLSFQCVYLNTMQDFKDRPLLGMWLPKHPHNQSEGLYLLLNAILKSAKQLEHFDFCIPSQHFEGECAKQANLKFGNLLASELSDTVTDLKLIMEIQENHLRGLKKLKLKKLHMNFYGSQLNETSIEDFLTHQAKTLSELRIADLENKFAEHLNFPQLDKVKFLEIKGGDSSSLSYLKSFPNLEKFVLRNGRNSKTSSDPDPQSQNIVKDFTFTTVTDVELTYPIEGFSLVQKIAYYFPNIKIFRIQAGPESTRAIETIFEVMTELVELQIAFPQLFSNQSVDPIFTGIPLGWCQRIREDSLYDIQSQQDILTEIRRKPCLENLRKLERLTIEADSYAITLTDVAVHYAFFKAPSLREITLDRHSHSISPECFQSLKTRMHVTERNASTSSTTPLFPALAPTNENAMALVPFL